MHLFKETKSYLILFTRLFHYHIISALITVIELGAGWQAFALNWTYLMSVPTGIENKETFAGADHHSTDTRGFPISTCFKADLDLYYWNW